MSRLVRGLLSSVVNVPSSAAGQATFIESGNQEWVVPEGVFSISVVLVGRGGFRFTSTVAPGSAPTELKRGEEVLLFAENGGTGAAAAMASGTTIGGSVGGGNGGRGAQTTIRRSLFTGNPHAQGGGGGAGGYSGNGGSASAGSGSGGGGAAGLSGASGFAGTFGQGGGGVGLFGQGTSGTSAGQGGSGGSNGGAANSTDQGFGGDYGGGEGGGFRLFGGRAHGGGGGALRYYNNLPVTPGETLTIVKPANSTRIGLAAARIIWPGDERQFPGTRTEDE